MKFHLKILFEKRIFHTFEFFREIIFLNNFWSFFSIFSDKTNTFEKILKLFWKKIFLLEKIWKPFENCFEKNLLFKRFRNFIEFFRNIFRLKKIFENFVRCFWKKGFYEKKNLKLFCNFFEIFFAKIFETFSKYFSKKYFLKVFLDKIFLKKHFFNFFDFIWKKLLYE